MDCTGQPNCRHCFRVARLEEYRASRTSAYDFFVKEFKFKEDLTTIRFYRYKSQAATIVKRAISDNIEAANRFIGAQVVFDSNLAAVQGIGKALEIAQEANPCLNRVEAMKELHYTFYETNKEYRKIYKALHGKTSFLDRSEYAEPANNVLPQDCKRFYGEILVNEENALILHQFVTMLFRDIFCANKDEEEKWKVVKIGDPKVVKTLKLCSQKVVYDNFNMVQHILQKFWNTQESSFEHTLENLEVFKEAVLATLTFMLADHQTTLADCAKYVFPETSKRDFYFNHDFTTKDELVKFMRDYFLFDPVTSKNVEMRVIYEKTLEYLKQPSTPFNELIPNMKSHAGQ